MWPVPVSVCAVAIRLGECVADDVDCRSGATGHAYADEYTKARKTVVARDQAYLDVSQSDCCASLWLCGFFAERAWGVEPGDDGGAAACADCDTVCAPSLLESDGPPRRGVQPEEEQVGSDHGRRAEPAGDVSRCAFAHSLLSLSLLTSRHVRRGGRVGAEGADMLQRVHQLARPALGPPQARRRADV